MSTVAIKLMQDSLSERWDLPPPCQSLKQHSINIQLHIACYSDFYIWHQDHQDHIHYFQTINNDWSRLPASKPGQTGLLKTQFPRWKFSWSSEGSVRRIFVLRGLQCLCCLLSQCSPCKTHKSPQSTNTYIAMLCCCCNQTIILDIHISLRFRANLAFIERTFYLRAAR